MSPGKDCADILVIVSPDSDSRGYVDCVIFELSLGGTRSVCVGGSPRDGCGPGQGRVLRDRQLLAAREHIWQKYVAPRW
jgi:hypothetical protein